MLPASLAPELLNGLLREKLGFNGMIVSDATSMAGMVIPMSRDKMVPQCIAAGCDMFLFTKNLNEDYEYMTAGVESGVISAQRLDEAVARILATKAALKLHEKQADGTLIPDPAKAEKVLRSKEFTAIEDECADKSVTLVKNLDNLLPLGAGKYKRVLLYPLVQGASFFDTGGANLPEEVKKALEAEGFDVDIFKAEAGFEGMLTEYRHMAGKYDVLIYVANLSTKSNQTTVRIEWAMPMGANCPVYINSIPTIFISFANPYHLLDVPRVRTFINAYKYKPANLRAVVDKLMGRSEFKGVSPVDPFCGKWDTHL
jgi:beta-N-acetylhexosaminidase